MRCHYEVLGLALDATIDDIKKAYRKSALQWHPDKHSDNKEEANRRFLEIQDAYETLSNDQERAWYDSHREIIINGGKPGETDKDSFLFNIFPYFSPTCYRGYADDEKGFYTVYREMFVKIADEDRQYYEEKIDIPEFGKSDSDYETVVGPFYTFWLSYCCPRSFVWVEKHDIREADDRYVRRIMEKENKKLRDKARKERNEELRKIVEHVRKRDKRVEQYKKILEEKALLAQQKVKDKKEAERLKRLEDLKNLDYDWSAIDRHLEELELEEKRKSKKKEPVKQSREDEEEEADKEEDDEEGEEKVEEEEESDYDESLYCVACDKSFQSAKSFQNHEKSKKHRENVELLKRQMKDENESFFENKDEEQDQLEEEEDVNHGQKQKLSKKQKKKKRQNRIELEMNEDSDEALENPVVVEAEQKSEEVEESPVKVEKQKKKKSNKKETKEPNETEQEKVEKPPVCVVCGEEFETRNKLFDHIKKEGHAVLKSVDESQPLSHNAIKKSKRLAKAKK